MLDIKVRIVEDYENICKLKHITIEEFNSEWRHISGFFNMIIGNKSVGCYYHNNSLNKDEIGGELVDFWLNELLDVIINLHIGKTYVAIPIIECCNTFIEFKKKDEGVEINEAKDDNYNGQVLFEPICTFVNKNADCIIDFIELKSIVVNKTKKFLCDLKQLNPQLLKTQMALELIEKIELLA